MNAENSATVTGCRSIQKPSTATAWAGDSSGYQSSEPMRNVPPGIQAMDVGGRSLIAGHGDPVALLGGDQVVGVLGVLAQVDLDPLGRGR